DAYLSVSEALRHAASLRDSRVEIDWIDSETLDDDAAASARLAEVDGVGIPDLGICLGMHVAVSEFARHVAGMDGATATEMDPETPTPVIDLLPEQKE